MYRDAAVARDVADDRIARYRVAAFGDAGHQVVHAADGDVRFCGASGCGPEGFWFCCLDHLGRQFFLDRDGDAPLRDLVAPDGGEEIVQFVVVQALREFFLIDRR